MSPGSWALAAAVTTLLVATAARRARAGPLAAFGITAAGITVAIAAVAAAGGDAGELAMAAAIEAALSVDTVVAVMLIFGYFAVPAAGRARLVGWVLAAAAVLRLAAIPAGAKVLDELDWLVYPLGGLLLATTLALTRSGPDVVRAYPPGENRILARAARWVPMTSRFEEGRLRVDTPAGRRFTPLAFVAAAAVAVGVVLAVDGVAAGRAVTDDTTVLAAATVLALVFLRELYTLAEAHLRRFLHAKVAMSILLLFAAVRLLATGADDPAVAPALVAVALGLVVAAITRPRHVLRSDHAATAEPAGRTP